ncbi:hypothetical protein LINGRAHAP2_LOCUS13328 [Linum grandiflorum]
MTGKWFAKCTYIRRRKRGRLRRLSAPTIEVKYSLFTNKNEPEVRDYYESQLSILESFQDVDCLDYLDYDWTEEPTQHDCAIHIDEALFMVLL